MKYLNLRILGKFTDGRRFKRILRILKQLYSYIKIFLLLVMLWVVLSGKKDLFLVVCGIISITITFIICIFGKIISPDAYVVKLSFFRYICILLKDIIVSSLQMVKVIYSEKLSIDPGTITMNVSKLTDQEKVLFANLVTMTPGTFVIAVNGDSFLIHALNRRDLEFRNNGEITMLLQKMRNQVK